MGFERFLEKTGSKLEKKIKKHIDNIDQKIQKGNRDYDDIEATAHTFNSKFDFIAAYHSLIDAKNRDKTYVLCLNWYIKQSFFLCEKDEELKKIDDWLGSMKEKSDVIKSYNAVAEVYKKLFSNVFKSLPKIPLSIIQKKAQFRILEMEYNMETKMSEDKGIEKQVNQFLKSTQSLICRHPSAYQVHALFRENNPKALEAYHAKKTRLDYRIKKL